MRTLNLNDPRDARAFLGALKIDGKPIEGVELAGGKWVYFADATDDQAVSFANQLMRAMEKKAKAEKYHDA